MYRVLDMLIAGELRRLLFRVFQRNVHEREGHTKQLQSILALRNAVVIDNACHGHGTCCLVMMTLSTLFCLGRVVLIWLGQNGLVIWALVLEACQ